MKKILFSLFGICLVLAGCKKNVPQPPAATPAAAVTTLKIGHVGHDHQLALYVALDYWNEFPDTGIRLKTIEAQKFYELYDKGTKIADLEIIKVGGGSLMPTALAQGVIDIGIGGVPAVMSAADSGSPVKLISPLHSKGDMFVVAPANPITTWDDFVKTALAAQTPIRIGYKDPAAVAKLVFEQALTHEGISFSEDAGRLDVKVHLVNVKGESKLNLSLGSNLIDGYVGNNPHAAIAVDQKIGKIICDLEDLPPGNFKNHPCCCIGANTDAIRQKAQAITAVLVLCKQATAMINGNLDKSVDAAVHWLGTSRTVEQMSIPTSGYGMDRDSNWQMSMDNWIIAMNKLGHFKGNLKGLTPQETCEKVYDFSLLDAAEQRFEKIK